MVLHMAFTTAKTPTFIIRFTTLEPSNKTHGIAWKTVYSKSNQEFCIMMFLFSSPFSDFFLITLRAGAQPGKSNRREPHLESDLKYERTLVSLPSLSGDNNV